MWAIHICCGTCLGEEGTADDSYSNDLDSGDGSQNEVSYHISLYESSLCSDMVSVVAPNRVCHLKQESLEV